MPNITSVLNDHVRRLARREITAGTRVVRKATAQYRRDIAALKRQVAALLKTVGFLEQQEKRRVAEQPVVPQDAQGIRFRAAGLTSHRSKLGLSAKDYGQLVGVAGLTIYQWESGKNHPRKAQLAKLAAVRGLGKREAFKRLQLLGGTAGKARGPAQYRQTAEEFVLELVRSRKATSTAQINAAWKKAGRGDRANNTLSRMVKGKTLKRMKVAGERGSRYSVG